MMTVHWQRPIIPIGIIHCRRSILLRRYVHRNRIKNRDLEGNLYGNAIALDPLNHGNPFITRIPVQTFPSSHLPSFPSSTLPDSPTL